MIDDFANCWVDSNNNGKIDPGEDWGFNKYNKGSAMCFLEQEVLAGYSDIKVTFFVPVGKRVPMIKVPTANQIAIPINADEESKKFFSSIHNNPRYELAYHGTSHGRPGAKTMDFIDEWEMFENYEEAVDTINIGKDVFEDATGSKPLGGKYCGYASKSFSDDTIVGSGFLWWCRYWNRGTLDGTTEKITGDDTNPITNFDIKYFGDKRVIDIPSTINGEMFDLVNKKTGLPGKILNSCKIWRRTKELEFLLKNRLVISIQEHMSPSRADSNIQKPNIYNDYASLRFMFKYLSQKDVWFCTCSELASYVYCRENTQVDILDNKTFRLSYSNNLRIIKPELSLFFHRYKNGKVKCPDGTLVSIKKSNANIPISNGVYHIDPD